MESVVWNSFEQFESATTVPQSQTAEATLNKILSTTAASLSMVGTMIIIATFVMWRDLRTNSRRIIVFISIGDFSVACLNTVGLYNPPTENTLCEIQATLNVVAVLSSFFWTVYLSLYLYLTICRKISTASEKRVMMFFHITAWGIPLMIAIFAYFLNGVGYSRDMVSSGWCWVSTDQPWWKVVLWMCLTGKSWEIFAYIAISVFYVLVKQEVSQGFIPKSDFLTPETVERVKKADRKLTFIPVVFIMLRIWGTIRFFRFLAFHPDDPPLLKWILVLHGVGDSSQGFANFVLFCLFTDKIRKKFRLSCIRFTPYCCRFQRKEERLFESTTNFPLNETSDFTSYGARDCVIAYNSYAVMTA